MDIETYLREQTQLSIRQLANKAGLNHSTLSRQLKDDRALTLETLRDISLATNLDFLDLAVRAELISQEHAENIRARGSLRLADSMDIIDELARRIQKGESVSAAQPVFEAPPETSPAGYPLAPDGQEFRPDLYQPHRMLWERYGEKWREHYTLAAKAQTDGDDIDETYTP